MRGVLGFLLAVSALEGLVPARACTLAGHSVWRDQFGVTLTLNGLAGSAVAPYCRAAYAAAISARSTLGGTIVLTYPATQTDCVAVMTETMRFGTGCTVLSGTWTNSYGETGLDSWSNVGPAGKAPLSSSDVSAGLH